MPLVVRDLDFSYPDRKVVLGVNATLEEGLIHLVVGATGSGKSTLALILVGLLKPDRGSVLVDGCDPASDRFDRSRLQLAFQFPEAQIFESSVEKEIEYGLRNFGLAPDEIRRRRDWAVERVGLPMDLLTRDPSEISFGERRKVALASVIALKPKYLILDEPLAGLDWRGRRNLVGTVLRLKQEGLATLVLTHETDLVAEMGDTVSLMAGGRLRGPMPAGDVLGSTELIDLDMLPGFVGILHKLKSKGHAVRVQPARIEELAPAIARSLGF